jgi:hypothetical protein
MSVVNCNAYEDSDRDCDSLSSSQSLSLCSQRASNLGGLLRQKTTADLVRSVCALVTFIITGAFALAAYPAPFCATLRTLHQITSTPLYCGHSTGLREPLSWALLLFVGASANNLLFFDIYNLLCSLLGVQLTPCHVSCGLALRHIF